MTCPPELGAILLDILRDGLLACRSAGWSGDAGRAAVEADHLHNIPDLLADYSPERLQYYWEVERPVFAKRCSPDQLLMWKEHWERLRRFIDQPDKWAWRDKF
ncbi:MAG: hypothetical protein J2P46_10355 [Zavarzinella sp.]|nr:hypothetical protein [Zavarzinella sp.]